MDLRAYYKKVREAEASLQGEHVVLVSLATPEGGKDGVRTEAPRWIAARLIAEGRSRVSTTAEAEAFHEELATAKHKFEQEEAAKRVQVMVIPSGELRKRERS